MGNVNFCIKNHCPFIH